MSKLTRRVKHEDRVPLGQVAVLGALDRDGAMTTSDLAADQRVRPQPMARAVGLLIEQNLITRRAHPTWRKRSCGPHQLHRVGLAAVLGSCAPRQRVCSQGPPSARASAQPPGFARRVRWPASLTPVAVRTWPPVRPVGDGMHKAPGACVPGAL